MIEQVLLPASKVAKILGVKEDTLYRWRAKGMHPELEYVKIGKGIRYKAESIYKAMKEGLNHDDSATPPTTSPQPHGQASGQGPAQGVSSPTQQQEGIQNIGGFVRTVESNLEDVKKNEAGMPEFTHTELMEALNRPRTQYVPVYTPRRYLSDRNDDDERFEPKRLGSSITNSMLAVQRKAANFKK